MRPHLKHAGLIILVTIALDQLSKYWIKGLLLTDGVKQVTLTPFLNLTPVWNHGISFGLMQASTTWHTILLIAATLGITALLTSWLAKATTRPSIWGLALTIGGAIGNIIDRILLGAVFDFVDVHVYGYHWPAFNVADSAICVGLAILLFETTFKEKTGKKK